MRIMKNKTIYLTLGKVAFQHGKFCQSLMLSHVNEHIETIHEVHVVITCVCDRATMLPCTDILMKHVVHLIRMPKYTDNNTCVVPLMLFS